MNMQREKVLENMREMYKKGDLENLRRARIMANFMLNDDDRKKIDFAIQKLTDENPLIREAKRLLT